MSNRDLNKLTAANNFYWISRLEDKFNTTAGEDMRREVKDIDLERVYKSIVGTKKIKLHLTDIGCAKVVILFDETYDVKSMCEELLEASSNGYYELVQLLVDSAMDFAVGDDIDVVAKTLRKCVPLASTGMCYLDRTFKVSHVTTLEILFDYLEGDDKSNVKMLDRALHAVATAPFDAPEIMEVLLRHISIDAIHSDVLMERACQNGHSAVVSVLLAHGVQPSMYDLCQAAYGGYLELVKLLHSNGAGIDEETLEVACDGNDSPDTIKWLIDNELGRGHYPSALNQAIASNNTDIIKFLVEYGTDPLYNDFEAITHVYHNSLKTAGLLLSYLDSLPALNDAILGNVGLIVASESVNNGGNFLGADIIEAILAYVAKRGFSIDIDSLNTALERSVHSNINRPRPDGDLVKVLLKYGADASMNHGILIQVANKAGYPWVARMLSDAIIASGKRKSM